MNRLAYILASLVFHLRDWAWVALGTALATVVIGGALLVGDALRASLAKASLGKLGFASQIMMPHRPVNADLAKRIEAVSGTQQPIVGLLLTQGSVAQVAAIGADGNLVRGVTIQGVDRAFWSQFGETRYDGENAWANPTLARLLGVNESSKWPMDLEVTAGKSSETPRESLLGRKDLSSGLATFRLACGGVLPPEGPGGFSLKGGLGAEPVLYVPREKLASYLEMPGKITALISANAPDDSTTRTALNLEDFGLSLVSPSQRVENLFARLDRDKDGVLIKREWQGHLGEAIVREIDRGLKLSRAALLDWYRKNRNHLTLESKQFYLSSESVKAIQKTAAEFGMKADPILVHLANRIQIGDKEIAYSVVAGRGEGPDNQATILEFPGSPFQGSTATKVTLDFFPAEHTGDVRETQAKLAISGWVKPQGEILDPDITPEFPGITDKLTLAEWNPPFPYDNRRIKPIDETYWKEFRTIPKVFTSLKTAQSLFGSRFGSVTSVLVLGQGVDTDVVAERFQKSLLKELDPEQAGLRWVQAREQALKKSAGNMDFSGLFLGFSFFLLVSAIALVSLLVQLHLERRSGEWGVLSALGWTRRGALSEMMGESLVPVLGGILVGIPLAVLYCRSLLSWLESHWPGGGLEGKLAVRWDPASLGIAAVLAFASALGTVWWCGRSILKSGPAALLASGGGAEPVSRMRTGWVSWLGMGVCLLGTAALVWLGFQVQGAEARAGCFFGSGALALMGLGLLLRAVLVSWDRTPIEGRFSLERLALRGTTRKPGRSLLTAGLLASSVFLLVAVDAFHRTVDPGQEKDRDSWSGGYSLWVELDLPLLQDPMTEAGKQDLLDAIERKTTDNPAQARQQANELLKQSVLMPFRLQVGDDISCLNLFQSGRPRILGVPQAQADRGGFRFAARPPATPEDPWRALWDQGDTIPVFGENNTLMWTLHKGMGDTIEWKDFSGSSRDLKVAGILTDSVFQSELLMAEPTLLRYQPSIEGYRIILAAAPPGREKELASLLNLGWGPLGARVVPSRDRLEGYLAVENTYLATFQALGFLGLLLGMVGMAIAQGRSVLERSGEWALMRAVGFGKFRIAVLVVTEIMALMAAGLVVGLAATVPAVGPRVAETGLSWGSLALLTGSVLTVGLASTLLAAFLVSRLGVLGELRRE